MPTRKNDMTEDERAHDFIWTGAVWREIAAVANALLRRRRLSHADAKKIQSDALRRGFRDWQAAQRRARQEG